MECQNCAFNSVVQAVAAILQTYTVVIDKRNVPLNPVEYIVHRNKKVNAKVAKAAADLLPKFNRLRQFVEKDMLPKCQEICRTCARTSNDDNLSRGGQTMVFMEAMPGAAGELAGWGGKSADADADAEPRAESADEARDREFFASDDEDEELATHGNWLNVNAIRTPKSARRGGVTNLPTNVEDGLRNILAAFKDLTILQKCVLLQRWDEMSFVDIGSMTWVPDEFRRHNDKQLVSFWWRQIVQKFPWADALSSKRRKKGDERRVGGLNVSEDDYQSHSPSEVYVEQELDFGTPL